MARPSDGVTAQAVAKHLNLDKSTVSRRLSVAGIGWLAHQPGGPTGQAGPLGGR